MAHRKRSLFLHEEVLLLALRDEEGTLASGGGMHDYALAGGMLSELLLGRRIEVDEGRRKLVNLLSDKPLGCEVLDEALNRVATAKRRASAKDWVSRFAHFKKLRHRVAMDLCRLGVLRADEDRVLLIFRRKIYPELDPRPERAVIERLRKAIFTTTRDVDPRTVVLLSLADGAGLLKIPFGKRELKQRKKRIEQLTRGELMGKATREAVQAAHAAVMVAVIVPTMVATTAAR
jgi:hypothetical protein